jgi:hypothetical protein
MTVVITLCGDKLINPVVVICTEENQDKVTKLLKFFMSSPNCKEKLTSLSLEKRLKLTSQTII